MIAATKAWAIRNVEQQREYDRKYKKEYYVENREKLLRKNADYRAENKDSLNADARLRYRLDAAFRESRKQKQREQAAIRRAALALVKSGKVANIETGDPHA